MDKIEFGTYNITIFGLKMVVKSGLKTVAFIAGKKNPADQNFYIRFSIENLIVSSVFMH